MVSPRRTHRYLAPPALIVLLAATAAAAPANDGWQKLWRNDNTGARAAFRAGLQKSRADLSALRGLGLLDVQEDAGAAALQSWTAICRLQPGGWMATACWPTVLELAQQTGTWGPVEDAARAIVAATTAPPELRASARLVLADAAERAGQRAESERLRASLGYIRKWNGIGPFDNVSLSGFEKAWPPEQGVDFSKTYPGKDDLDLRWYSLAVVSRDGECAVAAALGGVGPGVFYAATGIYSPKEQPVLLCFDPDGASKLFVNGIPVFTDDRYRVRQPLQPDRFRAPATLRQGWNALLVKIADDEEGYGAFSLRLITPSGDDVAGPQVDAARGAAPAVREPAAPLPERAEPAAVALLRKAAPANDPHAAACIAYHLRLANDYPAAIAALKESLKHAPDAGWLHWELSETLGSDGQPDEARTEREFANKKNPRVLKAVVDGLMEESETADRPAFLRRAKMLIRAHPGSALLRWALCGAYANAGMDAEAIEAARDATRIMAGPDMVAWFVDVCQEQGKRADALKALADGLRAHPHAANLLQKRAQVLSQEGKHAAAISVYERLLQVHGPYPAYRLTLAGLLEETGSKERAIATLRAARSQRPQDAGICARLANLLRAEKRTAEAAALYRVAIRLDPSWVGLRDTLRVLTGEKPVADLVPATPVDPILAQAPTAEQAAGASAVVLLDEMRQVVHPDGARVSYVRFIVKAFDDAAVKRYQEYHLPADTATMSTYVESARLHRAGGKVEKVEVGAGADTIYFPSLAPGDTVDVAYRREDYQRGGLSRSFWSWWRFVIPGAVVKQSRYVVIAHPGVTFQTRTYGAAPQPTVRSLGGWRVTEWRMADIPAGKVEPMGLPHGDDEIRLDISSIPSWSQIVRWYLDLSGPRCVPDEDVKAKAAELTRGLQSEEEKIAAMVRFVSRDLKYQTIPFRLSAYVPTEGKQVLRDGYGDCKDKAALLKALLSTIGVQSDMALLSGRSEGVVPYLPSPRFSHAVLIAHTAKGPLWVDATADQMEFGCFPHECQEVPALVINPETTGLITTPAQPVEQTRKNDSSQCTLGADGRLAGTLVVTATGNRSASLRAYLGTLSGDSRQTALSRWVGEDVEGAHYLSGSVDALADRDRPLVIRTEYQAEGHGTEAGDFLLARIPWDVQIGPVLQTLQADPSRRRNLNLSHIRGLFRSTVRLELPPGYTVPSLQPVVEKETPWGSYRITCRVDGNVLYAERETRILPLTVPVKEIPGFTDFLKALDKESRKPLVLKKAAGG